MSEASAGSKYRVLAQTHIDFINNLTYLVITSCMYLIYCYIGPLYFLINLHPRKESSMYENTHNKQDNSQEKVQDKLKNLSHIHCKE
jgi:hypothetical protein